MKMVRCIFILVFVFNTDNVFGKDLYCTDPHTGLHHSVNNIWPSTTFRGTYKCRIIQDTKSGEPRAVLQIIQNVDENNSKGYHRDRMGDTDKTEANEYFETLYKLASDFDESIEKSITDMNQRLSRKPINDYNENEPKIVHEKISEDCSKNKKNTIQECGQECDSKSNDVRVYNNCPPLKDNDEMTAAMYQDFNKYLAQYYAHRPECNYFGCKYDQTGRPNNDNLNTSPSEVYNDRTPGDSSYKYRSDKVNNSDNTKELFDQYYDNNWSNCDPTQTNPEQYRHEHSEETPKVSSAASHTDSEASNHMQDNVHKIEPHHHNHHIRNKRSAENETLPETGNRTDCDESKYETEYSDFYEEFVLKFPNSTAYSSQPTDEDIDHFYELYYERFPYKRPTIENDTFVKEIDPEKNDEDKNSEVTESKNDDIPANDQPLINDSSNEGKKEENKSDIFTNDEKLKENNDNSEDPNILQKMRKKRYSEQEHQKIEARTNKSNYDMEYRIFYNEYVSQYPKSTAFSPKPKDEDVKHFYQLYYKKFPYKQPKSENLDKNENSPTNKLAENLKKLKIELEKFGELKESISANPKSSENHNTNMEPEPEHKKNRRSNSEYDDSNYEAEYRKFYDEYISKYPNSTTFALEPKEEDVKHFNTLYYDRFPYMRPKPKVSKKSENINNGKPNENKENPNQQNNNNHDMKKDDSKKTEQDKSNYDEEYRNFYNRYISMYPKSTAFSANPKDDDVKHFNNLYYDKFPNKRPKSEDSEKPEKVENIDKLTETIKYVEKDEEPKYQIKSEDDKDLDDPFFFLKKRPVKPKPVDHDESNYQKEYKKFYHEYLAKYPCSTAYSSQPTDEDVRHFYRLYYEKFPYKLPKSESTKKTEYTQLHTDTDEHNEDEQDPEAPEFITTPDNWETPPDHDGHSKDLWTERKSRFYHQKDEADVEDEDEEEYPLTNQRSKYFPKFPTFRRDRINRKLGLDSPVFAKPPGSAEMKLLLSSKIEDIMRKLRERRPRLGSKFADYERTSDEY